MSTIPRIDPTVDSIDRVRAALAKMGAQGIPIGPGLEFDSAEQWTQCTAKIINAGDSVHLAEASSVYGPVPLNSRIGNTESIVWGGFTNPQVATTLTNAVINSTGIMRTYVGLGGTLTGPLAGSVLKLCNDIRNVSLQEGLTWNPGWVTAPIWFGITTITGAAAYTITPDTWLNFQNPAGGTAWVNPPAAYNQSWGSNLAAQVLDLCQAVSRLLFHLTQKGELQ